MTQGYGPEMFTLPKAAADKYQVRVKCFAQDANRASARTKIYATINEGFGTPHEKVTRKTVTRTAGKEMHDVVTMLDAARTCEPLCREAGADGNCPGSRLPCCPPVCNSGYYGGYSRQHHRNTILANWASHLPRSRS